MKQTISFAVVTSLILTMIAPFGAVFAMVEGDLTDNQVDTTELTNSEIIDDEGLVIQIEKDTLSSSNISEVDELDALEEIGDLPEQEQPRLVAENIIITEIQTRGVGGASSELIELFNPLNQDIDVTGWCVQYASATGASYTNRSCITPSDSTPGTRVILPARSYVILATDEMMTNNSEFRRDNKLTGSMADSGGRVRIVDEKGNVTDLVGWGGSSEAEGGPTPAVPSSGQLYSLQRKLNHDEYQDTDNNSQDFILAPIKSAYVSGALYEVVDVCSNIVGLQLEVADSLWRLKNGTCVEKTTINFCQGVQINEIGANLARQYIELTNNSDSKSTLVGCRIMTNRSQSTYVSLPDATLEPGENFVLYIDETSIKLTKSTSGTVYLMASDGETEMESVYYEDLSADTSWSRFSGGWQQTYTPTPGSDNQYAKYAPCQDGYWRNLETGRCNKSIGQVDLVDCGEGRERNPLTGRCRNIVTAKELTPCKEGQYRSEETNRCRSIVGTVAGVLKPCADDQFRNPLTNRCKKIASAEELADCGEGRERNPLTNRCRNIVTSANMPKAGFSPELVEQTTESMIGWWLAGVMSLSAVGYAIWQWRFEIRQFTSQVSRFFVPKQK